MITSWGWKQPSSEDLLNQSAGIMDAPAITAMSKLRTAKTPRDLVTRADIRNLNWVGAMSTESMYDNQDDVRRAIDASIIDWTNALGLMAGGAEDDDPLELVQRIDNFNPMLFPHDDAIMGNFIETYNTTVPGIFTREIERRRENVTADTHLDASKQMLESARPVRSDPQNVHDSTVNSALRGTLLKIKRADVDPARCIAECRHYIQAMAASSSSPRKNALKALDSITSDHIYTFGDTEDNIFAYVWTRASHPRNASNRDNIKLAIVDALDSAVEGTTTVCINGRASRILSALSLLDFDNEIANPKTLDMYRQQIFGEISQMISAETTTIASADMPLSLSARKYRGDDVDADDRAFAEYLEEKIQEHINGYSDLLAPNDLARLLAECRGVL